MYYKVELTRDLDPFYPEINLVIHRVSLWIKVPVAKVKFKDNGLIAEAYSSQVFKRKEDAIKVYNDYISQGRQ